MIHVSEEEIVLLSKVALEKLECYYNVRQLTVRQLIFLRREAVIALENYRRYEQYLQTALDGRMPVPYIDAIYGWFENYLGLDVFHSYPMIHGVNRRWREEEFLDFQKYIAIVLERRRAESETSGVDSD